MTTTDNPVPTGTRVPSPGWVLVGSAGLWAADCLRPGCLWTSTASIPEVVDQAAQDHDATHHPDSQPGEQPDDLADHLEVHAA